MDTKKLFVIIFIGGIASIMGITMYAMFGEEMENSLPVVNTLSSEQLAGVGYTDMTSPDDSDIWDDDGGYSESGTYVITEAYTEVSFPLDINTASAEEFMQINGIGSVTAENIVSYREKYGYFYSVEDLLNVDGIGKKKLADMMDYIFIDPAIIPQTGNEDSLTEETDITSVVSETEDSATITVSAESLSVVFPLELNTATQEELMCIDGIGQVLSERIVDYARQYGFNDVNDLLNVSGIGESKLKSIAPYIYVGTGESAGDTEGNKSAE